jgi:hypothetical protein
VKTKPAKRNAREGAQSAALSNDRLIMRRPIDSPRVREDNRETPESTEPCGRGKNDVKIRALAIAHNPSAETDLSPNPGTLSDKADRNGARPPAAARRNLSPSAAPQPDTFRLLDQNDFRSTT